jgi:hypothetical protein
VIKVLFVKLSCEIKLIPLTSDHKHLGITFSEEAKWNKQCW